MWPCGKGKCWSRDNTKTGIERGNSYQKNEEISSWKAQINTQKLNWYVSTITNMFLNQNRVNICEYTVKMSPRSVRVSSFYPYFLLWIMNELTVWEKLLIWKYKLVAMKLFQNYQKKLKITNGNKSSWNEVLGKNQMERIQY